MTREELWNGNRESLQGAISHADSLVRYALANDRRRRHRYPRELARFRVARLRTQAEVDAFLRSATTSQSRHSVVTHSAQVHR